MSNRKNTAFLLKSKSFVARALNEYESTGDEYNDNESWATLNLPKSEGARPFNAFEDPTCKAKIDPVIAGEIIAQLKWARKRLTTILRATRQVSMRREVRLVAEAARVARILCTLNIAIGNDLTVESALVAGRFRGFARYCDRALTIEQFKQAAQNALDDTADTLDSLIARYG